MTRDEVQARLERARSYDEWLAVLVRYFDSHELSFGHGTDNAADEAHWLIWHLLGSRDERWREPPDPDLIRAAVDVASARVETRAPLAYLLGQAWFAGLSFEVDRSVLVPRSPLAELIERRFEPWCRLRPGDRLLDVGTGSGAIAIAAAHYCPGILVDATEISEAALAVARRNVARHGLENRVRVMAADLYPSSRERYRVIISNPPYVPDDALGTLPPEYRHEPVEALVGGADGLDPTRRLLAGARERLEAGGSMIVEVGDAADALMNAFPQLPAIWIEFERGGSGVFVVSADELEKAGF